MSIDDEEVLNQTAAIMAETWECPISFAKHHIQVDRENERLKARIKAYEAAKAEQPDDWVLVPKAITLEMQHAYFKVVDKKLDDLEWSRTNGRYSNQELAYAAMLAAAPNPPKRESLEAILKDMRERDFDCHIHTNCHGTGVSFTLPSGEREIKRSSEGGDVLVRVVADAATAAIAEQGSRGRDDYGMDRRKG